MKKAFKNTLKSILLKNTLKSILAVISVYVATIIVLAAYHHITVSRPDHERWVRSLAASSH